MDSHRTGSNSPVPRLPLLSGARREAVRQCKPPAGCPGPSHLGTADGSAHPTALGYVQASSRANVFFPLYFSINCPAADTEGPRSIPSPRCPPSCSTIFAAQPCFPSPSTVRPSRPAITSASRVSQSVVIAFQVTGTIPIPRAVFSTNGLRAPKGGRKYLTGAPIICSRVSLVRVSSSVTWRPFVSARFGWLHE